VFRARVTADRRTGRGTSGGGPCELFRSGGQTDFIRRTVDGQVGGPTCNENVPCLSLEGSTRVWGRAVVGKAFKETSDGTRG